MLQSQDLKSNIYNCHNLYKISFVSASFSIFDVYITEPLSCQPRSALWCGFQLLNSLAQNETVDCRLVPSYVPYTSGVPNFVLSVYIFLDFVLSFWTLYFLFVTNESNCK